MKALIFNEKVIQIEDKEFPVCPEMIWIPCDESIKVGYSYTNGTFQSNNSEEQNRRELLDQLKEIDLKSIRALREQDIDRITELENQAVALRIELRSIP